MTINSKDFRAREGARVTATMPAIGNSQPWKVLAANPAARRRAMEPSSSRFKTIPSEKNMPQ
jgi:hypothetical protein